MIMPHIANLLLICISFQLQVSAFSPYFTYLFSKNQDCEGPEWFRCSNNNCVSFFYQCDGWDDCNDNSDEENCHEHKPINPPHIICAKDEYKCTNGDCIPSMKFCDTMMDCDDKSDEYAGCVNDLKCDDRFRCNDKHCILQEWVCDGRPDCLDGSDELNCKNKTFTTSDCHNGNDRYLCGNQRCIPLNMTCDKKDNCGDGSDEGGQCTSINCTSVQCNQECKQTPQGPICTCREGYKLQDNRTCIDIDECQTYGICDQECVNTRGSYKCACKTGFSLHADKKTCEADDGEPTMIFSTIGEIRTMYLKSKSYFISVGNVSHVTNIAIDQDYIYWSGSKYINNYGNKIRRVRINNEKDEVVIRAGIHQVSGLAVDWITHNIYFTDAFNKYIAVCNNNGIYCTKLIQLEDNFPMDIALLPTNGTMYWTTWGVNMHIAMAGMDGTNVQEIISENVDMYKCLTIDYPNNRLYWINGRKIESSYLDGTDRRIILHDITRYPVSLAVFENKLYWSDLQRNTIQSCNKFSGKDWNILIEVSNLPTSLHIYHPAIKPKFSNPCLSEPCSELCLLNQKRKYTCACTPNKKLNTDYSTCREIKKKQHLIIIAGNTFINYYHEFLENPKSIVSHVMHQITAVTCDPFSGIVFASDQGTNQIIRYNPTTGDVKNLFAIETMTLGGMAFDHIGNNLYLSNIQDNTIEVYSLTTMAKTIFYFDKTPYDIALVPEEGKMFVAYKEGRKGYYIHEMKMNGIGSTKVIKKFFTDTKILLHYNRDTKKLYWWDENIGAFFAYTSQDTNTYHIFTLTKIVNFAVFGDFLFWTAYDSNLVYYINMRRHDGQYEVAFQMPVTVEKPLVSLAPLYQIDIHEKYGCQNNNGNCSDVCLPSSNTSFICACPPKMMLSANNRTCVSQTACPDNKTKCSEHDICINKEQWCDGTKDCPNGEDEVDGCKETGKCARDQFLCGNGVCISWVYHCNSLNDCGDNTDEVDCTHCLHDEYECHDKTCISSSLVCDDHFDCPDYSDELFINCSNRTCSSETFKCAQGKCIPKKWVCDGENDCPNGEDETENCNSVNRCRDEYFECVNQRCISSSLKCNGIDDCGDNSDEICLNRADGYPGNCTEDKYHCIDTDTCLPKSVRCNGVYDCPKNDDEHYCAFCGEGLFTCDNQKCILQSWVCDEHDDCTDKSDEKNCGVKKSRNSNVPSAECKEFKCSTGTCLSFSKVCDNVQDCADNSDEDGECSESCTSFNPCKGQCYKTPLGPICGCRNGYRLATDNISCIDINECEQDDICSQICRNTVGSFTCSCFDGYIIRSDKISCKAIGAQKQIITATDDDIRYITSDLLLCEVIHPLSGLSITSLDVNAIDDSIYWTSSKLGFINKLNVKTQEFNITKDVGNPDALAVDWVTNNIYVSNNGHPNVIKVCNLELRKCVAVIKIEDTARVSALVLDPGKRWLFWSQVSWKTSRKPSSEIYRADMMGAAKKKIIFHNIDLVHGMAIDYMKSRLYWSDSFRKTIESSDLNGAQRRTFLNTDRHQPLGINIYENSLYWLIGSSGVLQKCKLYGNKLCTTMRIGAGNVHEHFAILQNSRHPQMENPCKDLDCNYMCVLSAKGASCLCQNVKPITDYSTCMEEINIQEVLATKNTDISKSARSGDIYGIIIITLLIVTVLLCAYYYYQRKLKLKALSDQSFNSIRFYNPAYDPRDEIAVTLGSIIPQSNISPGQHEYINPMNNAVNNKLLEITEENDIQMSEENLGQRKEEIEETDRQDAFLIPEIQQK